MIKNQSLLFKITGYFHPPELRYDLILERKVSFLIICILISGSLSFIMGLFNYAIKPFNTNTAILLMNGIIAIIMLAYLYYRANVIVPAQAVCFLTYMASLTGAYHTGGIYSLDLQAMLFVPVIAYMLLNFANTIVWTLIISLTFLGFYIIERLNILPLKEGLENVSHTAYYIKRGMLVVNVALLILLYEFFINNITEKLINSEKYVSQLKAELEEKHNLLLDNIEEMVLIINSEGILSYVNPAVTVQTGYKPEQLLGNKFSDYLFGINTSFVQFLSNPFSKEQRPEFEFKTINGKRLIAECTVHKIITKERPQLLITMINKEDKLNLEGKLEEMRKKIARDFHDELGNRLASISMKSRLLDGDLKNNAKLKLVASSIKDNAQKVNDTFRDFIWAIDKNSDYLHSVVSYLKDFGEDLFDSLSIDFVTRIQMIEKSAKLPPFWSRQLIFIFKEVMGNAAKHSSCKTVEFGVTFDNNTLKMWVSDDGSGFDPYKQKSARGLYYVKQRAREIGADAEIIATLGGGVKVELHCNLKLIMHA
ncbi:MAG: PAS domain-containing sensor histidine kinase [Cytophagaceae bacterium]